MRINFRGRIDCYASAEVPEGKDPEECLKQLEGDFRFGAKDAFGEPFEQKDGILKVDVTILQKEII